MITKQQLVDACRHETDIIKHIATKLPEGALDWRPTPGQRSTLELMQYLTVVSQIAAIHCVTGNWDHGPDLNAQSEQVTADTFADAMGRQMARIEEVLADIDEGAAASTPAALPWGTPTTQSDLLLRTVFSSFVAYRMQFFLYAKQSGGAELGTYDCWVGTSAPAG